jgi:hypothetical protein
VSEGETITAQGEIRLVRDGGGRATLHHGDNPLLSLALYPSWHAPSALGIARLALDTLRPCAPSFYPNATGRGLRGGIYFAPTDSISVFRADELEEHEQAEVILHELIHATGHPSRLARLFFKWSESEALLDPNDYATPAGQFSTEPPPKQQEELTARIGAAILSVRLGLFQCGGSHWYSWMPRAAAVPPASLVAAIEDAKRAVEFIATGAMPEK